MLGARRTAGGCGFAFGLWDWFGIQGLGFQVLGFGWGGGGGRGLCNKVGDLEVPEVGALGGVRWGRDSNACNPKPEIPSKSLVEKLWVTLNP